MSYKRYNTLSIVIMCEIIATLKFPRSLEQAVNKVSN